MLLASATAATLTVSCIQDAEDSSVLPQERLDEMSAEDPDKMLSATLSGMYSDLQSYVDEDMSHNYFGQKSFDYLTSLMGNDMIMTGRYAMSLNHYMCNYWGQRNLATSNRWKEYYRVIASANSILKNIDPETNNAKALAYRAQALTFRGYAYFQLTSLYQFAYYTGADDTVWGKGDHYDWSEDMCVPIVLEHTQGDQPRSTVKEVYDQLIEDLETAYNLFETLGMTKTPSVSDMDGCVAALYLARANMVRHNWEDALKYAQVVIDNYPILNTEAQILQGFSTLSLPDVIFGCEITNDNTTVYMSWFSQMDMFGDGYAAIGVYRAGFKPFVDRIADDDIRLDWFWTSRNDEKLSEKFGQDSPGVEYQSCKFIGAGADNVEIIYDEDYDVYYGYGEGWELGAYIYLRSEEAYLMKAEILAHQNKLSEAAAELTQFMQTRCPSYSCDNVSSDKGKLIEEIIFQKRVEFWGEGLEYLDNRRLNIPVDRTDETWGEDNNHLDGCKLNLEQENTKLRYQLPIAEIENNKMISPADQNSI